MVTMGYVSMITADEVCLSPVTWRENVLLFLREDLFFLQRCGRRSDIVKFRCAHGIVEMMLRCHASVMFVKGSLQSITS